VPRRRCAKWDFTPELRQKALKVLEPFHYGPLFTPPLHRDNNYSLTKNVALALALTRSEVR
jgi:hypothetical protein